MRPAAFRLLVLLGALPVLLLGFATSALANKVVFAFWAVAASIVPDSPHNTSPSPATSIVSCPAQSSE